MRLGGQPQTPAALAGERYPALIIQGAGLVQWPLLTDAENLTPAEIRSPDRPARSESLYRLRYPGPPYSMYCLVICLE
jgi:hypothetical protein